MKLIMEPRKHRQSYLEGKRKKNNTRVFAAEAANGPDEHQILLSISVRARSHQNLARELYACCLCGYFFFPPFLPACIFISNICQLRHGWALSASQLAVQSTNC